MSEVILRRAVPKDAELIHQLKYEAFLPIYERYHDDEISPAKEKIDKVIRQLTNPGSEYYLILVDGEHAGAVRVARKYVMQGEEKVLLPDENFISPIFILPKFQNLGVGQKVMKQLFEMYPQTTAWKLDTIKQEAGNCHFYEKCGFVRIGEEKRVNERMSLVDYEKVMERQEEKMKAAEKYEIRFAKAEDFEAVEKIMQQVQELHVLWRPDIYKACKSVLTFEEFQEEVARESFVVAESGGEVVGILAFLHRHIESERQVTRDVLFIDVMAVDEKHRGKGIGHQFFDFLKTLAEEKACDGIELQVNARNRAAYEMYRKCGFTEKSINMELV